MNEEDRALWLKKLPDLTTEHRCELRDILYREIVGLVRVDRKYMSTSKVETDALRLADTMREHGDHEEAIAFLTDLIVTDPKAHRSTGPWQGIPRE